MLFIGTCLKKRVRPTLRAADVAPLCSATRLTLPVRLLSKESYLISQFAVFARGVNVAVVINVVLSALVIGVAAWLSGRFPRAAGFLVALPLAVVSLYYLDSIRHS